MWKISDYRNNISLIDYLPNMLKDINEFKLLAMAEEPELYVLFNEILNAVNERFIMSASEFGVNRWEENLKISQKNASTLDHRKFTILTRLSEQLPYTIKSLDNMLNALCGADGFKLSLDSNAYILNVKVALTTVSKFDDVKLMLERVCPANIVINLMIEYNQHFKFKIFKHGELKLKTHYKLRNEVL